MDPKQLAVYEEFARNVPGFLPSNDLSQPTGFLAQPMKVGFFFYLPKTNLRAKKTRKGKFERGYSAYLKGQFLFIKDYPISFS